LTDDSDWAVVPPTLESGGLQRLPSRSPDEAQKVFCTIKRMMFDFAKFSLLGI
jgi:hypothetical protein